MKRHCLRRAHLSCFILLLSGVARAQEPEGRSGLSLQQAIELAEKSHPELRAGQAQLEAAEGRIEQAGLFPNPEAVVRLESIPLSDGSVSDAESLVGVSQAAPIGGRLGAARRVQELDRDRLRQELEVLGFQVRARVRDAFTTALYLGRTVAVHADAVRISENGAQIARARLAAGDAVAEEVARAEMELVRSQLELRKAQALRGQALITLSGAIGQPGLAIESIDGSLEDALALPALDSLMERLAESPLVAASEGQAAVQRAGVDLARAERIPDVNLDLFYRRIGNADRSAFDVGASLGIPLFDRNQGRLRAARGEAAAAEARVQATRTALEQRLRETHSRLAIAIEAARSLREDLLPRADAALESAETRYRAGDTSLTEVLPVRREWIAVRLAYLEALRDVMQASVELSPYVR